MEYKIVDGYTAHEIERQIVELLNDGWKLKDPMIPMYNNKIAAWQQMTREAPPAPPVDLDGFRDLVRAWDSFFANIEGDMYVGDIDHLMNNVRQLIGQEVE